MEMNVDFTIRDLAVKCRSKTELYNLLVREGSIFLPPIQDSTQKFLRELMLGDKQYINCNKVRVISVPHYKGLNVKDIIKFTRLHTNIDDYLPNYDYRKEPNRLWLCNLVNSLIQKEFQQFIDIQIDKRKQHLIDTQNLSMKIKPEFEKIFKESKSLSIESGKSHFLTRPPIKSIDKIKLEKAKEETKNCYYQIDIMNNEIKNLKEKLESVENSRQEHEENLEKLSKLYEMGVIDENGNFIDNSMH